MVDQIIQFIKVLRIIEIDMSGHLGEPGLAFFVKLMFNSGEVNTIISRASLSKLMYKCKITTQVARSVIDREQRLLGGINGALFHPNVVAANPHIRSFLG